MATLVTQVKVFLKKRCPPPLIILIRVLRWALTGYGALERSFTYAHQDSTAYWKDRALGKGQARVLWPNDAYNQRYRTIQREILTNFVMGMKKGAEVLDIGCGIGIVSVMLTEINPGLRIDAVDFPEMIKGATAENARRQIRYIDSSAEDYVDPHKRYELILSSACFSAIRNIETMERAISNCVKMLATDGIILMMDPFHGWNYLARAKYSSQRLIRFMRGQGATLIMKSGVLFWPHREWLAMSDCTSEELEKRFAQGENLLRLLGKHLWADYKVLAFKKMEVH